MLLKIFTEPSILIIISVFLISMFFVLKNYSNVKKHLTIVNNLLKDLKKNELSYRFEHINEVMQNNTFTNTAWEDFRKTLVFPDKLYIASQNINIKGDFKPEIYATVDASYFFNEETLVTSNINHKFIQIIPTLITGLGPFFTFLKMAIAFTTVNLVANETVGESLNGLMSNIQIAALCSVFAVGFSILFMIIEKNTYNKMCKKYYISIQKELIRLFDIVTSEKFLIDILKETKSQNITNEKLLKELPENFAKAIQQTISETTTPYLENVLFSLNKLNENLNKGSNGDVVDKLF